MSSQHNQIHLSQPVPTIMSGTGNHLMSMVDPRTANEQQQMQHVHNDQQQSQSSQTTVQTITVDSGPITSHSQANSLHGSVESHPQQHPHNPQRPNSSGSDNQFRSLVEPQPLIQSHQVIYSLSDHVDDDNDVFECGKCKQHFSYLNIFLQHKRLCNDRKNSISSIEKYGRELAEIELHLGIASTSTQQHLIHQQIPSQTHQHPHHSLGKSLLSSSANSSPLLIQSTNNSPTSMLNISGIGIGQQSNSLIVDINHRHLNHQNRSSPLVDSLNGSAINVNSILPDNDLLSLTSSLDANMIASIGNSISPSSLLHLQGGDVSSNTDDFAQFAHLNHIDSSNELGLNDIHQVQSRTTSTTGLFPNGNNNPSNGAHQIINPIVITSTSSLSSIPSASISVGTQLHHPQQQQQSTQQPSMNIVNFINTFESSSPSFTFIDNLSSTDHQVIGDGSRNNGTGNLLKTFVSGNIESTSNDNSIGSPSRFLSLPQVASGPSTPSSIIEHRPNQNCRSAKSKQTSSTSKNNSNQQVSQQQNNNKTKATLNVIHHSQQQQQQPSQSQQSTILIGSQSNDQQSKISLDSAQSQAHHSKTLNIPDNTTANNTSNNSSNMNSAYTEQKIFVCDVCQRRFTKNYELVNHMPCHTGEKPYQCCLCGKAFGQRNNLRKHIITHKINKEESNIAYKTSIDQSLKSMSSTNNKVGKKSKQPSKKQQKTEPKKQKVAAAKPPKSSAPPPPLPNPPPPPPPASVPIPGTGSDSVVCFCPMKCGATFKLDDLENLKAHCEKEHQATFVQNIFATTTATEIVGIENQQQLQQPLQQPIIKNEASNKPLLSVQQEKQQPSTSVNSSSKEKPEKNNTLVKKKAASSSRSTKSKNIETSKIKNLPADPASIKNKNEIDDKKIDTKVNINTNINTNVNANINTNINTNNPIQPVSILPPLFKVQDKFTCPAPKCGFVSTKETEFKMHCVDHTVANDENIRYRCTANNCEEKYDNIEAFIKHLQSHDKPCNNAEPIVSCKNKRRIFRCKTCLNRYTTENALQNHQAKTSHHYPCQHCTKVFPCERYLRRHMLTHGSGLFICKYCDKTFKTANYLKVHMIIHTGEKPFACKICDAAFNRRDKLKRHELVHDPIKRYKCPMNNNGCKREFNRPDKLKAHILTHSGVKPYQCPMCPRSFTRRAHLREHSKHHQNQAGFYLLNKKMDVNHADINANSTANTTANTTTNNTTNNTADNANNNVTNNSTNSSTNNTTNDTTNNVINNSTNNTTNNANQNSTNNTTTNEENTTKKKSAKQTKTSASAVVSNGESKNNQNLASSVSQKNNSNVIVSDNKIIIQSNDNNINNAVSDSKHINDQRGNESLSNIVFAADVKNIEQKCDLQHPPKTVITTESIGSNEENRNQNNGIILYTNAALPGSSIHHHNPQPQQIITDKLSQDSSNTNLLNNTIQIMSNNDNSIPQHQTTSNSTVAIQNPDGGISTFFLLYTCPNCNSCFLKEDMIKNHHCLGNKNKTTILNEINDGNNNPDSANTAAPQILVTMKPESINPDSISMVNNAPRLVTVNVDHQANNS